MFIDALFGHLADADCHLEVTRQATRVGTRSFWDWILPGLFYLVFVLLFALIPDIVYMVVFGGFILADFALFLMALIMGWMVTTRWRGKGDVFRELAVTPVPLTAIGYLITRAPLRIWLITLGALALTVPWIVGLHVVSRPGRDSDYGTICLMAGILSPLLLWFHYQTCRLPVWMLAPLAITRVDMGRIVAREALMGLLIIAGLTGLGIAITIFWVWMLVELVEGVNGISDDALLPIAGILLLGPGLLITGFLKGLFAALYRRRFQRLLLQSLET